MEVDYDPTVLSYDDLLAVFWAEHDPRGRAHSRQYRSAIFYRSDDERAAAEASKASIERAVGPVQTAIEPLSRFFRAEDYHQKYHWKHDPRLLRDLPLSGDCSSWAVANGMCAQTPSG